MESRSLCPAPDELVLDRLLLGADVLRVVARARRDQVPCPLCGQLARRVHSRYTRRFADLPWQGMRVELVAHVRRFFCDTPGCRRRIFAERCEGTASVYGHRTHRAAASLELLGFAIGGRAGARVAEVYLADDLRTDPVVAGG